MSIAVNVKNLIDEISCLSKNVLIVGASKTRSVSEIREANIAGICCFAENQVQEFVDKFDSTSDLCWHFIGQLQTKKAKYLVGRVEVIHSVDREKLIDEISKLAKKKNIIQEILIEINICGEKTKGGVAEGDFDKFYAYCMELDNVKVVGIMCVMQKNAPRKMYLRIKEIYDMIKVENKDIKYLSVGMSSDFAVAIECGANVVRIGTNIFGARRNK